MREYGQLQCAFWQSSAVQSWSDTARLLAAYLVTGPHSNGLGCYRLPDGYIVADFGWTAEKIAKAFAELSAEGFAYRFETVVVMPKFLRWNPIANRNVAVARQREFEGLPKGEARAHAARAMLEFGNHWVDGFATVLQTVSETVSTTVSDGRQNSDPFRTVPILPNPDPTQPNSPVSPPAPRPTKRCPPEFALTPEMLAWAAKEAPGVNVERETAAMRDHEFARARGDWPAVWRNWLRKASTANGRAPPAAVVPRKTRYEQSREALERATATD